MIRKFVIIFGWMVLVCLYQAQGQEAQPGANNQKIKQSESFLGCWQSRDDEPLLFRCEATRVSWYDPKKKKLQMFRAKYRDGQIFFNAMGRWIPLPVALKNGNLVFAGQKILHRINKIPKTLEVSPLPLGTIKEIPKERLKSIRQELAKRFKDDQAVRLDPNIRENWKKTNSKKMHKIDKSNTDYIVGIVSKYGWIDAERFGAPASIAAWAIVQHSAHLPLMLAVLPEVKKHLGKKQATGADVGFVNEPESYAMLFDRVRIMMGKKQRYGTQMGRNAKGETVILALEDKSKVDQFRKEIGLDPILPGLELLIKQNPKQAIKIEED